MLRALVLSLLLVFGASVGAAQTRVPIAKSDVQALSDALLLEDMVDILRREGLDYGEVLDRDMLGGQGGAAWQVQVDLIYSPKKMARILRQTLAQNMSGQAISEATAYFASLPGSRILPLENAARQVMSDPDAESLAVATFADSIGSGHPRAEAVLKFIEVNDLITRNVEGALNAEYRFLRGFADGRDGGQSDGEILSDVWARAEETRDSVETWITAYLYLAYDPLSDEELDSYIRFSETPSGQALNNALFAGFDSLYNDLSYALGQAVAQSLMTSDL